MFEEGEFFTMKFMNLFIRFMNSAKLSFYYLNEPDIKQFFDFIGFPLYSSDFFRTNILKKIFDIEKTRINEEIISKPFALSFDGSKINYVGDVLAVDVSVLDRKIFHKKSILNITKCDKKKMKKQL